MKHLRPRSGCIKAFITSTLFMGFSMAANAADVSITGNTLTVNPGGATPSISTTGIVDPVTGIPTQAGGLAVPSFTFTLQQDAGFVDGTYNLAFGVVLQDDNSNRRIEMSLPQLALTFTGATISGIVPAQNAIVKARNGANTIQVSASVADDGSTTIDENSVSFNAATLLSKIQASNASFATIINSLNLSGHFTYTVVLKQISGPANLRFGTDAPGAFTPFGCIAGASEFQLTTGGSLAATFAGGYGLQGRLSFAGAGGAADAFALTPFSTTCAVIGGGGGGGAPPPSNDNDTSDAPTVDEQQEAAQNSVNELNSIDFNDPTDDDIDTIVTVLEEIAQLGSNTAAGLEDGDVDADGALNVLDTLTDALQVTGAVTQGGGNIDSGTINNSLSGITDIFTALESTGGGLDANQIEKVQTITETTVIAVTELFTETTSIADTESLIGNIGNIISSAINTGASLDTTLIADAQSLTQAALESTLSDIAAALDSSLNVTFTDIASTQTLLSNNTRLLSSVLDTISIKLSSSIKLDQTSSRSTLEQSGVSTANAASLASDFAQFTNPDGISIATSSGTVSASDSFTNSLGGSFDLEVNSTTGVVDVKVGTDTYPVNIASVALVPDSIPDTAVLKSDGALLTISDGIATTSYPASRDPVAFASNLASLSSITDITITDITFAKNGGIQMTDGSSTFSGTFAFEPVDTTATSTGELTISAPTGEARDPGYSYKVNYPDGTSQNLLPFLADENIFDTLTDDYKVSYTTNRSTGVIDAGGVKFKPDYFLEPLDSSTQAYFDSNKDSSGFAYREKTTDSEGNVTSWEVISNKGVQVIYIQP